MNMELFPAHGGGICIGRPAGEVRQALLQACTDLATADRGVDELDPLFAGEYRRAEDDAARLRIVLDQVSLLTDAQAVARHQRLCR